MHLHCAEQKKSEVLYQRKKEMNGWFWVGYRDEAFYYCSGIVCCTSYSFTVFYVFEWLYFPADVFMGRNQIWEGACLLAQEKVKCSCTIYKNTHTHTQNYQVFTLQEKGLLERKAASSWIAFLTTVTDLSCRRPTARHTTAWKQVKGRAYGKEKSKLLPK